MEAFELLKGWKRLNASIPIIAFLFYLATLTLPAQTYTTAEQVNSRIKKRYDQALEYGRAGDWERALRELDQVLDAEPNFIDAIIVRAAVCANSNDFAGAETGYERVLALSPTYEWRVYLELARAEIKQQKYAEATAHLQQLIDQDAAGQRLRQQAQETLTDIKRRQEQAEFAARAKAHPVPFDPQPLGPNINTPDYEVLPSLTADGRFLIYTVRSNNQEDLYISEKKDGEWQPGQPIEGINTPLNEGAQSISANGKWLVFTSDGRRDAIGGLDLYFSERKGAAWATPRNMGPPVNTAARETQPSLSADGQELYFVSNRKGTLGGSDIWVSRRRADGRWSEPENLGPTINTPADEAGPFIHPDGQTLYFMSMGHLGMGGFDLFVARRQADGSWGEPQNLGYPINTEADEGALIVSLDGRTAYFASDRLGQQADRLHPTDDLYTFELYPAARPAPVTYVQAVVRDAVSGTPLVADITFVRLSSGQVHTAARTDADGAFLVVLPLGQDYALNVSREGYLFYSENFALADSATIDNPFRLEIDLQPVPRSVEQARPVVLRNVFFETGSAELKAISRTELDRLKGLLDANPTLRIRINGHTDNVGSAEDNQRLSEARAKAVYDYLLGQGIAAERLSYKGFGETAPIDTNDTEEGRQHNRRTEFEVIR